MENNNNTNNEVDNIDIATDAKDIIKADSTQLSTSTINDDLKNAKELAVALADSSFAKPFIIKAKTEDEEDYVSIDDMMVNILVGKELGMSPMVSLSLGKTLDSTAIKKVTKGRALGIKPLMALDHIYVLPNSGTTTYSYHLMNALSVRAKVTKKVLKYPNFNKVPIDARKNTYIDICDFETNPNKYFNIIGKSKEEIAKAFKEDGKILYQLKRPEPSSIIAEIELTRGIEVISIPYNLQQAIDAKLYKGVNSDDEIVDGKDNWNNHPADHLMKMSLVKGLRIIAPDILQGGYWNEEISNATVNINETLDPNYMFEEATIIE